MSRPFVGREESRHDRARIPESSPSARPGDPRDSSGTWPVEAGGPVFAPRRLACSGRSSGRRSLRRLGRSMPSRAGTQVVPCTRVMGRPGSRFFEAPGESDCQVIRCFWPCQDEGTSAPGRPIAPVSKGSRLPCGLGSPLSKVPWHVDSGTSCSAMHLGPNLSGPDVPWNLEHDGSLSNLGPGSSWSPDSAATFPGESGASPSITRCLVFIDAWTARESRFRHHLGARDLDSSLPSRLGHATSCGLGTEEPTDRGPIDA